MYGSARLTKQEVECYEMFELFDAGAHDLILKTNIKQWERVMYGGRPELYPQDRKALFTMLRFKAENTQARQKKAKALAELQKMKGLGFGAELEASK